MKQRILDRRLAIEFAVIVIGVFVALAAESWWAEREERQYEREIREDMVVEFESNIRILDVDIEENEQARKQLGMLEGLTDDALIALSDNELSEPLVPYLSLIHISEPTRHICLSRMPSSA